MKGQQFFMTMAAIIATGGVLYAAGEGYLGSSAKDFARIITKGYGV